MVGTWADKVLTTCFLLSLLWVLPVSAEETAVSQEAARLVRHLEDELPSIRVTIRKLKEAPEAGTFTIWDKDAYEEDLNEYLDDAIALLLPETHRSTREELHNIDETIAERRKEKSATVADRAFSPTKPKEDPGVIDKVLSWLTDDEFAERLRSLEEEIRALEEKRNQLIYAFRDTARGKFGIELDMTQAEALLYQVNGVDLIDAIAVANILTEVERHIRQIIVKPEDVITTDLRLQYYGFALIVRLIIERLHSKHLENYEEIYLPALVELEQDNLRVLEETNQTLEQVKDDKQHRMSIETNIRVLSMARRAITDYHDILMTRRRTTERMLRDAHKDALVARSTLLTLEMVMNVQQVASTALAEFAALSKINLITYEAHLGRTLASFVGDLASSPAFGLVLKPVPRSLAVPSGPFSGPRADRMSLVRNQEDKCT